MDWDAESTVGAPRPPGAALLLDWRQIKTPTSMRWEGLVASGHGGGELPWNMRLGWVRSPLLRPAARGVVECLRCSADGEGGG